MSPAKQSLQNTRFIVLYALAWGGGAIAYSPFLAILLPGRISVLSPDKAIDWIGYLTFTGAVTASIAAIVFGWLSDISHARKRWVFSGLVLSNSLLIAAGQITDLAVMLPLIIGWQIAVNMMLAPLAAWAGDCVPDQQKGMLGGFLATAPAVGALSGAFVTVPGVSSYQDRLILVAVLVTMAVLPVLIFGKPRPMPQLMSEDSVASVSANESRDSPPYKIRITRQVGSMWAARLLIQISEAALFAYLLIWLRSLRPGFSENMTAQLFSIVMVAAVPVAMFAGRWADRRDRPIYPLFVASLVSATGLMIMALAPEIVWAIVGYAIFGVGAGVFLALHSAQTLRVLPRPSNRGRDLGIFNLTNTVPSLFMPWLTIAVVPGFGFPVLLAVLSGLALVAAMLLLAISRPSAGT